MLYDLPTIVSAAEEVARVQAMTASNREHSLQILAANQAHFDSKAAGAFAHAITVVNNAYDQAAADIQQASAAIQFAAEHMGHQDAISAAQYGH